MGIVRSVIVLALGFGSAVHNAAAAHPGPPQVPECTAPTTTTTTTLNLGVCLVQCARPTSVCRPGEPTGPTAPPPQTTTPKAPPGACVATVDVVPYGGCDLCPTCAARPGAAPGDPFAWPPRR